MLARSELRQLRYFVAAEREPRSALGPRQSQVTPLQVAGETLRVYSQRDYPEYCEVITGWLRDHRQQRRIAGEHSGEESLIAAIESSLGVALVTTQIARLFPKRVQLIERSSAPQAVCIAIGHRAHRADDKPLAVLVAELGKAAPGSA